MGANGGTRPSAAMLVALIALVAALGGTAVAALKVPAKSVGTKQLKNNAVTGKKVKDGALTAGDFAAGQLPAGPPGSAVAWGRVAADGTVSDAQNLAFEGRGTNPTKVYCMNRVDGEAVNVQATPDSSATDPLFVQLAVTTDQTSLDGFGCPETSDFMVSADSLLGNVRGVDAGFYVAVIQ